MVIAPREQRGPSGRAEGGSVEVVVAETILGHAIKGRSRDGTTERTCCAETRVVRKDQKNIGGALGSRNAFGKSGFDSLALRPMTPLNACSGMGSSIEPPCGTGVLWASATPDNPMLTAAITIASNTRLV